MLPAFFEFCELKRGIERELDRSDASEMSSEFNYCAIDAETSYSSALTSTVEAN
jgi:hypothetical protein